MSRLLMAASVCLLVWLAVPGVASEQAARPNIVLMFPDNLGWVR